MNKVNPIDIKRTVWLSLGANLGDRQENLLRGMGVLLAEGMEFVECSGIYETEPVGYQDQPQFLNLVLKVKTALLPSEILALCRKAEEALKRERNIPWGPRTLDVDILLIDDQVLTEPELVVPHPRMRERAFVLGPLAEIDNDLLKTWGFPHLTKGICLKITAADVKILLQQRGWLS